MYMYNVYIEIITCLGSVVNHDIFNSKILKESWQGTNHHQSVDVYAHQENKFCHIMLILFKTLKY